MRLKTLLFVFIALVLLCIGIISGIIFYLNVQESRKPLIQPLGTETGASPQQKNTKKTVVYGFLPYWNIKTANINKALTTIGYFSLTLDPSGEIQTRDGKSLEQGLRIYQSDTWENVRQNAQAQGQQVELVITMMDADEISNFLLNQQAKNRAIETLGMLVQSQPISGINIDIEYAGTVTPNLRNAYSTFIQDLRRKMKSIDKNSTLSIDVFADTAQKERIWDLQAIEPNVDYIIVMAYDFHRSSSPVSGPVAPIFGSEKNRWSIDIMKSLKAYFPLVPEEKILLGVPFYGYEWRTVSDTPGSQTYPKSGGIATYKRIQQLLIDRSIREKWDYDALSPYITYVENGKIQTIYYENAQSLTYKLELVKQANLAGIAIWALGYEGNSQDLWNVISTAFPQ